MLTTTESLTLLSPAFGRKYAVPINNLHDCRLDLRAVTFRGLRSAVEWQRR